MSSAQGIKAAREPVVERHFVPTPESCADAVALLLRSPADMKKAARPGGPDDVEESKNDRTAEPDYSR